MKGFYKSLSIQRKLTTAFLVCTLIPMLIIFIFGIASIYDDERREYDKNAEGRLLGAVGLINSIIDSRVIKSENIIRNYFIINGLKKDYDHDISAVMEYYSELNVFMEGFGLDGYDKGGGCTIYPMNKSMLMGRYVEPISVLEKRAELWEKLTASENPETVWCYENADSGNLTSYISFFRRIIDYENNLGYFEVKIYLRDLIGIVENVNLLDGEELIFKSGDGNVIYHAGDSENGEIVHTAKTSDGSSVSCIISKKSFLGGYYKYILFYVLGFGLGFAALFIIYRVMISRITGELNDFINVLQNDDDTATEKYMSKKSFDPDISLIKRKFNNLLMQTKKMYSDIAEMNKMKKSMELELLQSGINPHLLYNSLSVIKWQMIRLRQNGMAKMIDNMTNYYRSVLAGGNSVITIEEELELTDRYISINEFSYENKYTVIKDIDEKILSCPIIKLILQPIVENALLHGLVEKDDGVIKISIKQEEPYIILTICDNGYGMTDENIKKALDTEKPPRRKGGYGISNTIKRIKTYYGDECGISIKSEIGEGTAVSVRILKMDREELSKRIY